MQIPRNRLIAALAALALAAGVLLFVLRGSEDGPAPAEAQAANAVASTPARRPLGLMTTLPIYWPEAEDLGELLVGDAPDHWAKTALERQFDLRPLDTLDSDTLADIGDLLLAQPRALSPAENVALDEWVRGGGRVLLFADPFLTGESRFHVGDRRRPQDVVILSPILARWGLELAFADDQPDGVRQAEIDGVAIPIALAGHFMLRPPAGGAQSDCALMADGLAADCRIGEGRALVIADATLLENGEEEAGRSSSLESLADRAFDIP